MRLSRSSSSSSSSSDAAPLPGSTSAEGGGSLADSLSPGGAADCGPGSQRLEREEESHLWRTRGSDARSPRRHARSPFWREEGGGVPVTSSRAAAHGAEEWPHQSLVWWVWGGARPENRTVHLGTVGHGCGFTSSADAERETMPDSALQNNIHRSASRPRVARGIHRLPSGNRRLLACMHVVGLVECRSPIFFPLWPCGQTSCNLVDCCLSMVSSHLTVKHSVRRVCSSPFEATSISSVSMIKHIVFLSCDWL